MMRPFRPWRPPWPQTWGQVYAVIIALLLGFLALAYALDCLKQALGRWPCESAPAGKGRCKDGGTIGWPWRARGQTSS